MGHLKKGVIAGAENNPPTFISQSHYEVCKHFTFDHHSRIPDVLTISSTLWQQLSDQEKSWILTAAREASQVQREMWQKGSDAAVNKMKELGVTIHHPDITAFESIAGPAAEQEMTDQLKALRQQIQQVGK